MLTDGKIQDHVFVLDIIPTFDPSADRIFGLLTSLGNVFTSRPHSAPLRILDVLDDPERLLGKRCPSRDPAIFPSQQSTCSALHDNGVTDITTGAVVFPGRIRNFPPPVGLPVKVAGTFILDLEDLVLSNKRIASEVPRGARSSRDSYNVSFNNGVVQAVDHRVHSDRKYVLMIMGIEIRCNSSAEGIRFVSICIINLQNTSETNFEFDITILIKIVIPNILLLLTEC